MQLNGDQKNSELLHLLRLNGHVGTIPTCFVSFEIDSTWRRNWSEISTWNFPLTRAL